MVSSALMALVIPSRSMLMVARTQRLKMLEMAGTLELDKAGECVQFHEAAIIMHIDVHINASRERETHANTK
jgi:hypothetical protein